MTISDRPAARRAGLDPAIRQKLGRLRGVLRRRLLGEGLARLVVALVAAALITLAVDYGLFLLTRQHMTVTQRLLVIAVCLAGVGYVAWRYVVRPQLVRMTEDDLALLVERSSPHLGDRLISALQFSRVDAAARRGASQVLIARIVEQANEMARPLTFVEGVRSDRAARHAGAAVVAAALLAGLFLVRGDVMRAWSTRNLLLRDASYPRDTHLAVERARFRVARGAPLEVVAIADPTTVVPANVTFHMKFPSVGDVEETVSAVAPSVGRYAKKFEVVNEPFTFYVTGNDDRTAECAVEVAEPPALKDVTFTIDAPGYTHVPRQVVGSAQGVINVPVDSTITVSGTATKDLSAAAVLLDGVPAGACDIKESSNGGGRRSVTGRFPVKAGRPFKPSVTLRFALTDSEGFASAQGAQYTLALVQDKPPTVQVAAVGVGGQVSSRAMIPVQFMAKDDYGVRDIELEWTVLSAAERPARVPVRLLEPDEREPGAFPYVLDLQALKPAKVASTTRSATQPTTALAGATTQPAGTIGVGESVRLAGIVRDAMPAPDGPNAAISNPLTFKIVSDEDLLAGLIDSQRTMREQFRQAISAQSEARGKASDAADRAKEANGLEEARQLAAESADQQQQVTDRVAAVAARMDEILQQMTNNRVGADPDKARLRDRIVAPLRELTSGPLRKLGTDLAETKALAEPDRLSEALAGIAVEQDAVRARLEAVLGEMIKVENAQQLEHGLKQIIESSQRVQTLTRNQEKLAAPATKPAGGTK